MLTIIKQLIFIFTDVYALTLMVLLIGLMRLLYGNNTRKHTISVIVIGQKGVTNIGHCIESLLKQTYPKDKYKVLVIDDIPQAQSRKMLDEWECDSLQINFIQVAESDLQNKLDVLQKGIDSSDGELIFTTSTNCILPDTWLEEMNKHFEDKVGAVVGFADQDIRKGMTFPQKIQSFVGLIKNCIAAGTMSLNVGLLASTQNMGIRRRTFEEVGGFDEINKISSYDINLLIQKIHKKTEWKFRYSAIAESFVKIDESQHFPVNCKLSFKALFYHRWQYFILGNILLMNLTFCICIPLALFNFGIFGFIFSLFFIKALFEMLIVLRGCKLFKKMELFPIFFVVQLLYLPYGILKLIKSRSTT